MLQFQLWKKLLVVTVAVMGIIFALPNLIGGDDGVGAGFLPGKQINLGLDLQGGSHLLLRVDVDAVKQERLENLGETLRRETCRSGLHHRRDDWAWFVCRCAV